MVKRITRMKSIIIILTLFVSLLHARFIPWKSPRFKVPKHFPTLRQIYKWCDNIVKKYPGFVTLEKYGYSYRGKKRNMKNLRALIIRDKKYSQKRVVFFNGGIHAREFMSVYVPILWVNQTLEKIKNNHAFWRQYIKNVKIIVIPVINPDGYEMARAGWNWRKNARPVKYRSPWKCPNSYGVDLNRNFSVFFYPVKFSWHYTWGGAKPFSEPETAYLRDYLIKKNISVSLSLHSYGRYLAFPWWGNKKRKIKRYTEHKRVAKKAVSMMRGYTFRQGCPYPIRGNFGDWIYKHKRCLTFTIEIGDSFNPSYKTSMRWYKEIRRGIDFILSRACKKKALLKKLFIPAAE